MLSFINGQTGKLWGLMGLLISCTLFFLSDAIADLFGWEWEGNKYSNDVIETIIVMALTVAVGLTAIEIRTVLKRQQRMEDQLRAASGAFKDLLEDYFERWCLTPSERDVALLAIKGLSIAEIARIRDAKEGTVKAQSNSIYRKAEVSGRLQLLSLFIEDLMSEPLTKPKKKQPLAAALFYAVMGLISTS